MGSGEWELGRAVGRGELGSWEYKAEQEAFFFFWGTSLSTFMSKTLPSGFGAVDTVRLSANGFGSSWRGTLQLATQRGSSAFIVSATWVLDTGREVGSGAFCVGGAGRGRLKGVRRFGIFEFCLEWFASGDHRSCCARVIYVLHRAEGSHFGRAKPDHFAWRETKIIR